MQVFALEQNLVAQRLGQCRRDLQRRAHRQLVNRGGEDFFHVILKQGLSGRRGVHQRLLVVFMAPETENENPPLGRVRCSRQLARQIRNGGNNAWLATQCSESHDWKLAAC
ncbi:hypothetical protein D3C73_1229310 [compost metagenome]